MNRCACVCHHSSSGPNSHGSFLPGHFNEMCVCGQVFWFHLTLGWIEFLCSQVWPTFLRQLTIECVRESVCPHARVHAQVSRSLGQWIQPVLKSWFLCLLHGSVHTGRTIHQIKGRDEWMNGDTFKRGRKGWNGVTLTLSDPLLDFSDSPTPRLFIYYFLSTYMAQFLKISALRFFNLFYML